MLGFAGARWRRAWSLDSLDEWGLCGRPFGTFIAWFLIGVDVHTASALIAVPATLCAGSAVGFFAVTSVIAVYLLISLSCHGCGRSATGTATPRHGQRTPKRPDAGGCVTGSVAVSRRREMPGPNGGRRRHPAAAAR